MPPEGPADLGPGRPPALGSPGSGPASPRRRRWPRPSPARGRPGPASRGRPPRREARASTSNRGEAGSRSSLAASSKVPPLTRPLIRSTVADRPPNEPRASTSVSSSRDPLASSTTRRLAPRTFTAIGRASSRGAGAWPDPPAGPARSRSPSSGVPSFRRQIRTEAPSTTTSPGSQWPSRTWPRWTSTRASATRSQGSVGVDRSAIERSWIRRSPQDPSRTAPIRTDRPVASASRSAIRVRAHSVGTSARTTAQARAGTSSRPSQGHRPRSFGRFIGVLPRTPPASRPPGPARARLRKRAGPGRPGGPGAADDTPSADLHNRNPADFPVASGPAPP